MAGIGQNIRRFRKVCGYTQEELALQLNVTSQAISRWESGAGMPDVSLLVPLSKALGVTLDTLFGEEQEGAGERLTLEERIREIIACCERWGIERSLLAIEITESALHGERELKSEMDRFREAGRQRTSFGSMTPDLTMNFLPLLCHGRATLRSPVLAQQTS